MAKATAGAILERLQAGQTREQIAAYLEETQYKANVAPSYPLDAYRLNTNIMIGLIEKELLKEDALC